MPNYKGGKRGGDKRPRNSDTGSGSGGGHGAYHRPGGAWRERQVSEQQASTQPAAGPSQQQRWGSGSGAYQVGASGASGRPQGQQSGREGQGSDQQASRNPRTGTSTAGYPQSGTSGAYQKGAHAGGRPQQSGKSDERAPKAPDPTVALLKIPNPYISAQHFQKYGAETSWKPFVTQRKDVVLHQCPEDPATWSSRNIVVSVNHFPINGIPTSLFQYDVKCVLLRAPRAEDGGSTQQGQVQPPQERRVHKDLTEAILKWLIPILRNKYGHQAIATNLSSNLYTTVRLEDLRIPLQYQFTVVELKAAGVIPRDIADERDESQYVVTFQFANEGGMGGVIDTTPLAEYMRDNNGTLKGFRFTPEMKQTLEAAQNAFLKSVPRFPFYSVGRSTIVPYDADGSELGEGLMAWKGISMNIGMGWKPFLNLEIANTAMVKGANVLVALKEVLNLRRNEEWKLWDMGELGSHLDKIKGFLRTTKVEYRVDGRRFTKTVRDIFNVGASHPNTKFDHDGRQVTVFEYFKARYGVILRYPNGPLMVSNNDAKIPAELCTIKEGQSVNRKLTGQQTDKMLEFAKRDAKDHYQDILANFRELKLNDSAIMKGLGIQIPNEGMLKISNARVLVPPAIRYGEVAGGKAAHLSPTEGTWDIWRQRENFNFYRNPAPVDKWGVLVVGCSSEFETDQNYAHLQKFISLLSENGARKGLQIDKKPTVEHFDYDCEDFDGASIKNGEILKSIFENNFKKAECRFVLVVTPAKGCALYGHVKHAAEVDVGILTQCFQLKSVIGNRYKPGPSPSLVQLVIPKLHAKLGGVNHVTVPPINTTLAAKFCTLLMDCPVLVIGADVTHPPPGSKKIFMEEGEKEPYAPSYAAVTGSLDRTCMPFMTELRAQRKAGAGAAEVIQDLEAIVKKMIRAFWETSGKKLLPFKIIYFRDGVGEGQFPEVLFSEMSAIRRACENGVDPKVVARILGAGKKYEPPITFITVQKRHKTRIFWHYDPKDPSKVANAPAGTVVDQEVVHPMEVDFYLLSHFGALGTSRPSRYHVLWDDSDFSLDQLQSLAYTLCYMYARCTKSVKMPAPTYYAHLAADRAKKLCEGFERKLGGEPSIAKLNQMLARGANMFWFRHPMHFI